MPQSSAIPAPADTPSIGVEQDRVLELMATGAPLAQALDAIVVLIERQLPAAASVMLADEGVLRLASRSRRMPDVLVKAVDGLKIAEGVGACGTAAARRQPVVVSDLLTDPLTQAWHDVVVASGMRSCWSIPVVSSGGEVLATFALYFPETRTPAARDRAAMETAGRLTRIALERERANQGQRQSQTLLHELAEKIEEVFYVRDVKSGAVLYVSPTYERVWGRSADSLVRDPLSYLEAIHPDDRAVALAARAQLEAGEKTWVEYRVHGTDGRMRWILDRTYPVAGPDGRVQRVVGIAQDLTERKQADLRLAAMNRALGMLSQCNQALALREDEPGLLGQVCRVAVETGGYRMAWVGYVTEGETLEVQPAAHAGHEDGYLSQIRLSVRRDDPSGTGPVATALRTGGVVVCEDIEQADGFYWKEAAMQRGYRSVICLPLPVRERNLGVLALYGGQAKAVPPEEVRLLQELAGNLAVGIAAIRARAERHRVQQEVLRLNAELERRVNERTTQLAAANRELETFSYSLAHDLRGPLGVIAGFSQALQEALEGRLEPREQHYVDRVLAAAQRMAGMIDALLSMARLSREPLRWTHVDLGRIARAELESLAEHEPGRPVEIEIEDGLIAWGDERLLRIVMQNLVGNAWKFSRHGRPARIAVGRTRTPEGRPAFFVRDNGVGFDMAHASRLFTAFERLHTEAEFEGTGLGLANSQRIVERHGGRIWVEAVPGQGAVFRFSVAPEPPAPAGIIGTG